MDKIAFNIDAKPFFPPTRDPCFGQNYYFFELDDTNDNELSMEQWNFLYKHYPENI